MRPEMTAPPVYESPTIVDYGDLLDLTQAMHPGESVDAAFPAATRPGRNQHAPTFSTAG